MPVKRHILAGNSNHYNVVLSNTVDLVTMEMNSECGNPHLLERVPDLKHQCVSLFVLTVFKHIILSGQQMDVNDVTNLDREKNWLERSVKEAVWVRTKNPPLNCQLLHQNCTQLFSICEKIRK